MAYNERGHAGDLDDRSGAESAAAHELAHEADTRAGEGGGQAGERDDRSSGGGDAGPGWRDSETDRSIFDRGDEEPRTGRRRSLFGRLAEALGSLFGTSSSDAWHDTAPGRGRSAAELARVAREAFGLHPDYGNQSTAHVAAHYGQDELTGKSANEQVEHMRERWREVSARAAQDLANRGELAVAGLERPGGTGHTAVVTPGEGATHDGDFYPHVTCGGPRAARSDGTKTAADVWPARHRQQVRYYTPR